MTSVNGCSRCLLYHRGRRVPRGFWCTRRVTIRGTRIYSEGVLRGRGRNTLGDQSREVTERFLDHCSE